MMTPVVDARRRQTRRHVLMAAGSVAAAAAIGVGAWFASGGAAGTAETCQTTNPNPPPPRPVTISNPVNGHPLRQSAGRRATVEKSLSLTGFGIGLVVTAITSALLGSVAPAQSGVASGTFTAARQTGSVLGVALFGTLLAGLHPSTGLEVTFAIGAGLVAVVAILGHAAQ